MVRYAQMVLKIGFHAPFGPKFAVEFGNLDAEKIRWPTVEDFLNFCERVPFVTFMLANQENIWRYLFSGCY